METGISKSKSEKTSELIKQIYDSKGGSSRFSFCCEFHKSRFNSQWKGYNDFILIYANEIIATICNLGFRNSAVIDSKKIALGAATSLSVFKRISYVEELFEGLVSESEIRRVLSSSKDRTRVGQIQRWLSSGVLAGFFGQAPSARSQAESDRCGHQRVFCTPSDPIDLLRSGGARVDDVLSMLGVPYDKDQDWVEVRFDLTKAYTNQWPNAVLPKRGWKFSTPTALDADHWMYWPSRSGGLNHTRNIKTDDPGLVELIVAPFKTDAIVDMRLWPQTHADYTTGMHGCYRCPSYARPCPTC